VALKYGTAAAARARRPTTGRKGAAGAVMNQSVDGLIRSSWLCEQLGKGAKKEVGESERKQVVVWGGEKGAKDGGPDSPNPLLVMRLFAQNLLSNTVYPISYNMF
jgi:hypothetical protein